jgi:hypothetical protein
MSWESKTHASYTIDHYHTVHFVTMGCYLDWLYHCVFIIDRRCVWISKPQYAWNCSKHMLISCVRLVKLLGRQAKLTTRIPYKGRSITCLTNTNWTLQWQCPNLTLYFRLHVLLRIKICFNFWIINLHIIYALWNCRIKIGVILCEIGNSREHALSNTLAKFCANSCKGQSYL